MHSKKFNLDFTNSHILDLFAGVGSFGIECLSRKVKSVIFAENYSGVIPILKEFRKFKIFKKLHDIRKNIYEDNFFLNLNMNFDLILDPPYKDKNLDKLLLKLEWKNTK